MPYAKASRRRRRRRYTKSRPWYDKKYSTKQLAIKAWKGVRYIKSMVNAEKGLHDVNLSSTPVAAGAALTLNAIAQGDTQITRDGRSILMKYLSLKYQLVQHITPINTLCRIVVVMDKQTIADSTPSFTTVFQTVSMTAHLDRDAFGRFTILYDKTHVLSDAGQTSVFVNVMISLNKHAYFNGTASTDIQKNNIFLLTASTEAADGPAFAGQSRLRYYDN